MRDLTLRCLASFASDLPANVEVITVINGDEDATAAAISARFPEVTLIVNDANRGVGPARNQGLKLATGDVVILLDADTTTDAPTLEGLAESVLSSPDIGVVGPRLLAPDGTRQGTARHFPTPFTKLRRRAPAKLRSMLPDDAIPDGDRLTDVGYVIGACQALRRDALAQTGLLDESIFYGPEDVDLCLRMWRSGWRVIWNPGLMVVHHEQRITRKRLLSRMTLHHLFGLGYYFVKHRYLFRAPTYPPPFHGSPHN